MNGSIIILPYKAEHILREKELVISGFSDEQLTSWAQKHEANGVAWSGFADGHIIAAGGVHFYWPGVGEAWTFMTSYLHKYRFSIHKHTCRMLNKIISENNLHRVQAVVDAGNVKAIGWIESLGFDCEGMMKKYGTDGNDCYMYGRVK